MDRRERTEKPAPAVRDRRRGRGARVESVADFNALHSRKHDAEVQLYAFDFLALDGEDLRRLLLSMRKTNLARLLARRPDGIFVAPFEQGEIGPDLFRATCDMGLEGLVSKRRDRPESTIVDCGNVNEVSIETPEAGTMVLQGSAVNLKFGKRPRLRFTVSEMSAVPADSVAGTGGSGWPHCA